MKPQSYKDLRVDCVKVLEKRHQLMQGMPLHKRPEELLADEYSK